MVFVGFFWRSEAFVPFLTVGICDIEHFLFRLTLLLALYDTFFLWLSVLNRRGDSRSLVLCNTSAAA